MKVGDLAALVGVSADTVRYYEREGLLQTPARSANGYRNYAASDVTRLRFVRGAQALGFALSEIRALLPRLAAGQVRREEIEAHLRAKIAQIDGQRRQLLALRRELVATFDSLQCAPAQPVSIGGATTAPRGGRPLRQVVKFSLVGRVGIEPTTKGL